ncbi:MAG: DUF5060 domain-containing protein [Bryobacteraceae bacterium]
MNLRHLAVVSALAIQTLPGAVSIEQYQTHDFSFRATVPGNPFDVELTGEFSGPNGQRLRVPGFYDGDGTWKIRFSPPAIGAWSLRTASPLAALSGHSETAIQCVANRNPNIHGGLRVDAVHPHHFVYEDGTRYFLMGYEADWLWALDMSDPERTTMRRLINQMAERRFNHVMVNIYAHDTAWSPGKQNQWDFGPPEMYAWEGTNEKPDHSRFNVRFFQLYDGMMTALRDKGIVAHIMLKVYNKMVKWPPPGSDDEARYFRYVTARYQAFSNVVWDFSKEAYNEKNETLQARLIDLVRDTDAYHRLTTAHDDEVYEWDPELSRNLDFRTDQQHTDFAAMIAFDRARRAYPVVNSEFAYERGVDKLPTYRRENDWQEQLRRAWHIYLAGGYGVYYYNNTAWDLVKIDPEPPGMKPFQLLSETLSSLPYWRMTPSNELSSGPCLALEGDAYAFYSEGQQLAVHLRGLADPALAKAEWIDTWTGAREPANLVGKSVFKIRKPEAFGQAPALLLVRK